MSLLRPFALAATAMAIVAAAVPAAGSSSAHRARVTQQECGHGVAQYATGPEVVFGRVATQAAAETLRGKVAGVGFVNAAIEQECDGFRVAVRGYDTYDTAVALQAEAQKSPFRPTVECYQAPDKLGELEAVLGYARDRPSALLLVDLVASRGFRGAKLENEACGGYEVIITGFTSRSQADAFVQEAQSVGFDARLETNS